MLRKLSLICAVAGLLFPGPAFAAHRGGPGWHGDGWRGPGWGRAGWGLADWARPGWPGWYGGPGLGWAGGPGWSGGGPFWRGPHWGSSCWVWSPTGWFLIC